jgi:signal transduction histidine kinase/ActR/RegA family two-component response regulator
MGKRFFTGIARNMTKRKRNEFRLGLQNSVTQILADSASLAEAGARVLEMIGVQMNWQVGEFWALPSEEDHLEFVSSWHQPDFDASAFYKAGQTTRFTPGVGIPGRIWSTKAPLWLDAFPENRSFPRTAVAKASGLNAAFGFPIFWGDQVVGVIDFFSHQIRKPEDSFVETMQAIASQIGQFIERSKAQDQVGRILSREHQGRLKAEALARQLSALQRVTDAVLATFSLDDLLLELLKRIREVLNVDTAAVLLLEKEENELLAWAALGLEEEVERGIRIPVGSGFAGRVIAEGKPVIIPDVTTANIYNPLLLEKGISSLLGVPLFVEGRAIGVIHVGTFRQSSFTDEDIRLLQLVADRIALSIEKARLNEIERKAREAAEKANLLKDEFLTILSHELRTPLTPIMGWSSMMLAGLLPESDYSKALSVISKNSQGLKRLIDDLLDMSAILSGKMRIEQGSVSLDSTLLQAVENVSNEARAGEVELIADLPMGTVLVKGDQARLVQTFSNLLHNAIKFTPKGGSVSITTSVDGDAVLVSVADSGIGIDSDFLPHVFERFRQADGSRTRVHGGLGLGLALVKSFVEAHGGEISVTSDGKDRGAIFLVRLPLEFTSGGEAQAQLNLSAERHNAHARILIVEDQADTLDMLAATFAARGFEVTACPTGVEALQAAEHIKFDALVSDIAMPEVDGFELIRRLRQMPGWKTVPAVALTGYASEKDAAAAKRAGFNTHLCKPVEPAELTTLVEDLLKSDDLET